MTTMMSDGDDHHRRLVSVPLSGPIHWPPPSNLRYHRSHLRPSSSYSSSSPISPSRWSSSYSPYYSPSPLSSPSPATRSLSRSPPSQPLTRRRSPSPSRFSTSSSPPWMGNSLWRSDCCRRSPSTSSRTSDRRPSNLERTTTPSWRRPGTDSWRRWRTGRTSSPRQPRGRVDEENNELDPISTIKPTRTLRVRGVDWMVAENTLAHETSQYEITRRQGPNGRLVVRRGEPFKLKLYLSRDFDPSRDIINLVFNLRDGTPTPPSGLNYAQHTQAIVPVVDENSADLSSLVLLKESEQSWYAKAAAHGRGSREVLIYVTPSARSAVGVWTLEVDTNLKGDLVGNLERYTGGGRSGPESEELYILFNPWWFNDSVYLKDPEERREYVLADSGLIWRGTHQLMKPTPWSFGQFETGILEVACYVLARVGHLAASDRGDPVRVSRHLSNIVNSNDHRSGLVEGRWDGNYAGGRPPTAWSSSVPILQAYLANKRPVKYGQCWVFAGVLNTLCRALGIPARPVTCYHSAHDTHRSLTVDRVFNEDGDPVKELNTDSIWNFHSWVEVWMQRPDLSAASRYDGWQVIDATPQEPSDGLMRCGPVSVLAVKEGGAGLLKPYDGHFVFAEVNADEVYWLRTNGGSGSGRDSGLGTLKLLDQRTDTVGLKISTKSVGDWRRESLTDIYKHREGSRKERETVLAALRYTRNQFARLYLSEQLGGGSGREITPSPPAVGGGSRQRVGIKLLLLDDVLIGQTFHVTVRMRNRGGSVELVSGVVAVHTALYTGALRRLVKKESRTTKVGPRAEEKWVISVPYEIYGKFLEDQNLFKVTCMASVANSGGVGGEPPQPEYVAEEDFRVRLPDIKITIRGDVIEGKSFLVVLRLLNPLPRPLTRSYFLVEGPSIAKSLKLRVSDVPRGGTAHGEVSLKSFISGQRTISAKFFSDQLTDVDGYLVVRVAPAAPSLHFDDGGRRGGLHSMSHADYMDNFVR